MARCLTCGRRAAGPHPPCASVPATAPEAPEAAPFAVPGYRVERALGQGGFGVVLAAVREADGRRAALKVARAGVAVARAQLAREEEALRAIGPPAVPSLLGAGALGDGSPYLALELVEAPSLATRLEEASGPIEPDRVLALGRSLVEALAAVHAAGFAHGDLKPENVLLEDPGPRARLLDLGLAERLSAAAAADGASFAGTPEYMAPEQCRGGPPDARSDVYAAGVVLFEMATGRPPFFGAPGEVRQAHLTLRPPRPGTLAAIAPQLEEAILRCLAKEPADRFPTAAALGEALARIPATGAAGAPDPPPAAASAPAASRAARRRVGVVYLESPADAVTVQAAATALGGRLAHAEGGRFALVFDAAAAENPVRVALRAAWSLVERGIAPRALADLATVTALARPGAGDRYASPAFAQASSYPRPDDPPGALATARAGEVLVGVSTAPVPGREGLLSCMPETRPADEATVVRQGAAPLLGRDELLADLEGLSRRAALGGAPAVAAVVAEPGMGRTHLAAALADRLRSLAPSPEVLEIRARPADEAGEGSTLRALLRWALGLPAGSTPPPAEGGRTLLSLALPGDEGGEVWPGVALAMGWMKPDAPELRARAAAPGALQSLTVRAAGALLRRRAGARPLSVVVDDAHLADGAALDALEYAALAEAGAPVFVCALARPSFLSLRTSWGERAASSRNVRLGPLAPEPAAELCRRLLLPAEGIPAAAVERLVTRSQGVPLLLVELVRGLRREGLVRRHPQGGSYYLATDEIDRAADLPLVGWLAERELSRLPADLAAHAQLAALLGDEVTAEETAGVLAELERAGLASSFPLDAASATRRLTSLGLLVPHRSGRTGFRLSLVREAVARSTPDALRRAIHEAGFRFYGGPGAVPDPVRLPRLARHAVGSGRGPEAAAVLLALADELRARHAWLEAEALYSRALENLPDGAAPPRLGALRGRGLMRTRLGRRHEAVADLAAARAAARALGDRSAEIECLLDESTALDWLGDFAASRARAEEAAALDGSPPTRFWARLELARGRSLFRAARWEEARAALEAAAALAERQGDEGYEARVAALLLLGTSLPTLGRPAEGESALARAQALAQARGDGLHLGAVLVNRRNLLVARGDLEGAVGDQRAAVRLAREAGLLHTEYFGEYNAAELFYQAEQGARAEPHLRRAVEIEQRHPEVAPVPLALLLWARLLLHAGDIAGARRRLAEFRSGVARARALGWPGAEPGPPESVLADAVDLATGQGSDADWAGILERSARDSVEQEPIEIQEMRALAALRSGRRDAARAALEAALDLGARIPNLLEPRLRRALASLDGA